MSKPKTLFLEFNAALKFFSSPPKEKIHICCIIYYNCQRVKNENFKQNIGRLVPPEMPRLQKENEILCPDCLGKSAAPTRHT